MGVVLMQCVAVGREQVTIYLQVLVADDGVKVVARAAVPVLQLVRHVVLAARRRLQVVPVGG